MNTYYIKKDKVLQNLLYVPLFLADDQIIPSDVTELGERSCSYIRGARNLILPSNIEVIRKGAFFQNASLESIVIPETVKTIEDGAFAGCTSLKKVVYSNKTQFGQNCFNGCANLNKMICEETEVKVFYIKSKNNFIVAFPAQQNEKYNLYMGTWADENFPNVNLSNPENLCFLVENNNGEIQVYKQNPFISQHNNNKDE